MFLNAYCSHVANLQCDQAKRIDPVDGGRFGERKEQHYVGEQFLRRHQNVGEHGRGGRQVVLCVNSEEPGTLRLTRTLYLLAGKSLFSGCFQDISTIYP